MRDKKLPTVESTNYVHKGFFDLRIDTLKKTDGTSLPYTVLATKVDAVSILAEDREKRLILNKEYRHPIGKYLLSAPGGRMEKGEDPIEAAARELVEETGYRAKKLLFLGSYYPLPSICDQKIFLYFAPDAERSCEQKLDPFECIQLTLMREEELMRAIKEGSEIDGVLAAALLYKNLIFK